MTPRYGPRYASVTARRNGRNGPFRRARSRAFEILNIYIIITTRCLVSCWKSLKGLSNNGYTESVTAREGFQHRAMSSQAEAA